MILYASQIDRQIVCLSLIVFVAPRSKRAVAIPSPAVPGFQRVDSIKILGVTISRRFSLTDYVDHLLAACAQTLFALRTLKQLGLQSDALQLVFQATVIGLRFVGLVGLCKCGRQGASEGIPEPLCSSRFSFSIEPDSRHYMCRGRRPSFQTDHLQYEKFVACSSSSST